jgi:N-acyl-L-homoserine lactone synthetase
MISILTNADRDTRPETFDAMFRARAAVFHDRLGWAVAVKDGWETDRYDRHEDPVYVVTAEAGHRPTGSLCVLPTTGETMLRNELAGFFDEPVDVESPTV